MEGMFALIMLIGGLICLELLFLLFKGAYLFKDVIKKQREDEAKTALAHAIMKQQERSAAYNVDNTLVSRRGAEITVEDMKKMGIKTEE